MDPSPPANNLATRSSGSALMTCYADRLIVRLRFRGSRAAPRNLAVAHLLLHISPDRAHDATRCEELGSAIRQLKAAQAHYLGNGAQRRSARHP